MIRKWIEIIFHTFAALLLFMRPAVSLAGPAGTVAGSTPRWVPARTFPVRTDAIAAPQPLAPLPGVPVANAETVLEDGFVPDISYSYFWTREDGLRWRSEAYARHQAISEHSPGLWGGFERPRVRTPGTRWLPVAQPDRVAFGDRSWQAQLVDGAQLSLGSSEIGVPEWNESVRLGGISLSQSFLASSEEVSRWNYSLAFGAVDQSAAGTSGDLVFGPMAGSLATSYDYSPQFSLETRTEVSNDLFMSGISGQYDLGSLGRWRSGIARSEQGVRQGWRYRAMADFDLADDMSLGWMGERYSGGFMDLRRYAAGSGPLAGGRQRWSASWDAGRWGEWSGSVESLYGREGLEERRFGLSQQFWYGPRVRVGIHAQREVISDDYDIGLRFSFPLY